MKSLICISMVLFGFQLSAQKRVYREIAYNSQKIVIELNDVDKIELENNNDHIITIRMEDYVENPTSLIIKESDEIISILVTEVKPYMMTNIDKFCAVQPLFPTYQISIPSGAETFIYYNNGNFNTKNFQGILNLKVNKGKINIEKFEGSIFIRNFSGSIFSKINNTVLDVISNNGKITINKKSDTIEETSTSIKGVYGNSLHRLKVRSVNANITLNAGITQ